MKVGIIGNGATRFTDKQVPYVKALIRSILTSQDVVVSGHSPVGGVDIWAEEVAKELGLSLDIKVPTSNSWEGQYGFKARNLDIAKSSDVVHVIVAESMPDGSIGPYGKCYHCQDSQPRHVKSGACWTAKQAQRMGKTVFWHIVNHNGSVDSLKFDANSEGEDWV